MKKRANCFANNKEGAIFALFLQKQCYLVNILLK